MANILESTDAWSPESLRLTEDEKTKSSAPSAGLKGFLTRAVSGVKSTVKNVFSREQGRAQEPIIGTVLSANPKTT